VAGTNGNDFGVGDHTHAFSIMSVSKPFVFALVCESTGSEEARRRLGVNSIGLPFNSLQAIEQSRDGRTNPMVNPGTIATTSLVHGATAEAKWQLIHDGLSRFAGRPLSINGEVYEPASETNQQNRSIARLLQSYGHGGGIVTVAPGKGGLGTFAPELDDAGNSVRGQLAAAYLARALGLDLFASQPAT
jgi:glutaminase